MTERSEAILVVDDEPAVLEVCRRVLQRSGYHVVAAASGAEALARFQAERFDLLLSDIKMPDLDGLEVLRRVKEINPAIPVVLITGFGTLETAIRAVQLGAAGFLLKPFHGEDLSRAVEEALSKSRLWRENVRLKTLFPLLEATQALVSETDPARLHQVITAMAVGLINADEGWLLLYNADQALAQAACAGQELSFFPESALHALPGILGADGALILSVQKLSDRSGAPLDQALQVCDLLVIPIVLHKITVGYLLVGRSPGRAAFEEGDLETLKLFGRQAAVALENAELFRQLKSHAEHLEEIVAERTAELRESEAQVRRLYEASRKLHSSLDFDQVISNVLALAVSIAGAKFGGLTAFDTSGRIHRKIQQGEAGQLQKLESNMIQELLARKGPLLSADIAGDEKWNGGSSTCGGSAIGIPLMQEGQVLAVLILWHPEKGRLTAEHRDLLFPVCSQAAAILANALLFQEISARLDKAYTEIQERARQLEMTTQQLVRAERLALMGQLAAGISHELGNVIAPLQVYADLLANCKPGDADYIIYSRHIQTITERGKQILRQFTDFARKDQGQRQPVDLGALADRILSLLEYFLLRGAITVHRDYASDLPAVSADPGQLEQVFTNIIMNAMDAMPEGGDLYVTVRRIRGAAGEAQYVEALFTDTGCGITPGNLERVFEPFFTTKEVGKGTGLGLFISYGIIERHGGSIDIESKPGKGTTVKIRLPATD